MRQRPGGPDKGTALRDFVLTVVVVVIVVFVVLALLDALGQSTVIGTQINTSL